jgi:WD40 repeat protein
MAMSLILDCRGCGQKITVPDDWDGQGLSCPSCHRAVDVVPPESEEIVPELLDDDDPSTDLVEVVEEEEATSTYGINADDALLPDLLPGQAPVCGVMGIMSLGRNARPARCLAVHPQKPLALAGCGPTTYVLNLSERKRALRFEKQDAGVTSLALAPDGRLVLSGDRDGGLLLWDLSSGQLVRRLKGHKDAVGSIAFSPNGRYAVSGGDDGVTRLWELETGEEYKLFEAHWDQPVRCVAFSPDGRQVLGAGGKVRTWSVKTGELHMRFRSEGEVDSAAFSRDGAEIAACVPARFTETGLRVQRWHAATGKELPCFEDPFRNQVLVFLAVVAPGTLRIVSLGRRPGIRQDSVFGQVVDAVDSLRSRGSGWEPSRMPARYYGMGDLRRGRSLDSSDPYCMQIWNLKTGLAESHDAGQDRASVLAVSTDGSRALTANRNNTVQLWGLPP